MKVTFRIPAKETYGYIEIEQESTLENIPELLELYDKTIQAYKGENTNVGLSDKDFNQALDTYLSEGTGDTEQYMLMSKDQQNVFQQIKKSLKRQEYGKSNTGIR